MIGMADEPTVARAPTSEERTRSWVEERFRALGFNSLQAEALADCGADWHEAENLIIKGCRRETAVDLLT